ncbi:MAG TPA: hypothetical protein VF341_13000 [Anaeromyxobacteraceae bacterium]
MLLLPRSVALVAVGLLGVAGCASLGAQRAREQHLREELDAFRYTQPVEEVWAEARRLLAERGYPLVGDDAKAVGQQDLSLAERIFSPAHETHPYGDESGLMQRLAGVSPKGTPGSLSLDTGWNSARNRYRLDAIKDDRGVRVIFTRVVEDRVDHHDQATRDAELELALAQRLAPDAAARIEAVAGAHSS